jgi:hypothetical protein
VTDHQTDSQATAALRRMVREVLKEVLPSETAGSTGESGHERGEDRADEVRRVQVRDDRELADLVTQVLNLAEDPHRVADLRSGRIRFALAADDASTPCEPGPIEVDRGAVTERLIHRAAREQRSLLIGARAVVTPLARDRARALGVTIDRRDTR